MTIVDFSSKYEFLSPYHECDIFYKGFHFNSILSAFASARFSDPYMINMCANSQVATLKYIVKDVTRGPLMVENFELASFDILCEIVRCKFKDPVLRNKLLATGDELIIYISKSDFILGTYKKRGRNLLGMAYMDIRRELNKT